MKQEGIGTWFDNINKRWQIEGDTDILELIMDLEQIVISKNFRNRTKLFYILEDLANLITEKE